MPNFSIKNRNETCNEYWGGFGSAVSGKRKRFFWKYFDFFWFYFCNLFSMRFLTRHFGFWCQIIWWIIWHYIKKINILTFLRWRMTVLFDCYFHNSDKLCLFSWCIFEIEIADMHCIAFGYFTLRFLQVKIVSFKTKTFSRKKSPWNHK